MSIPEAIMMVLYFVVWLALNEWEMRRRRSGRRWRSGW
jgi:hypothetical protein